MHAIGQSFFILRTWLRSGNPDVLDGGRTLTVRGSYSSDWPRNWLAVRPAHELACNKQVYRYLIVQGQSNRIVMS